jgi:hypothetical protein
MSVVSTLFLDLFVSEQDLLFWVDSDRGSVTSIKRDGTNRHRVVEHHESVENIAIDWITGKCFLKSVKIRVGTGF